MKQLYPILIFVLILLIAGCSGNNSGEKGFALHPDPESTEGTKTDGFSRDSLKLNTRPGSILLTGFPEYRLTTIYKVNLNRKSETTFIGSNRFHTNYSNIGRSDGNNWNNNFMPGLEAVYGYNMVNISHYNTGTGHQKTFFEKPVLVRNLYFPSFSNDTLNHEPVKRNYFMVSVYNEDTNKDNFINLKDLRRFYLFDINGNRQKPLVPENYSVFKSEYDPANDFMYVYAQLDENNNGRRDEYEPTHIFWINLKNPSNTGRQY